MNFYEGTARGSYNARYHSSDLNLRSQYASTNRIKLPSLPLGKLTNTKTCDSDDKHLSSKYKHGIFKGTNELDRNGRHSGTNEPNKTIYRSRITTKTYRRENRRPVSFRAPIELGKIYSYRNVGIYKSPPSNLFSNYLKSYSDNQINYESGSNRTMSSGAIKRDRLRILETEWKVSNVLAGFEDKLTKCAISDEKNVSGIKKDESVVNAIDKNHNTYEIKDKNDSKKPPGRRRRNKAEDSVGRNHESKIWSRMSQEAIAAVNETRKEMGLPGYSDEEIPGEPDDTAENNNGRLLTDRPTDEIKQIKNKKSKSVQLIHEPIIINEPTEVGSDSMHYSRQNHYKRQKLPQIGPRYHSSVSSRPIHKPPRKKIIRGDHEDFETLQRYRDTSPGGSHGDTSSPVNGSRFTPFRQKPFLGHQAFARKMFREQSFQITPLGYDSRYNVPYYNGTEDSEIIPEEVQEKSVRKCQDWLVKYSGDKERIRPSGSALSSSSHF